MLEFHSFHGASNSLSSYFEFLYWAVLRRDVAGKVSMLLPSFRASFPGAGRDYFFLFLIFTVHSVLLHGFSAFWNRRVWDATCHCKMTTQPCGPPWNLCYGVFAGQRQGSLTQALLGFHCQFSERTKTPIFFDVLCSFSLCTVISLL